MKGRRILVIDDEEDVRRLLVELLGRAGYSVETATNGREGLKALFAAPPDLVVLDVSMPAMDGWEMLDRIRDLGDLPVLMLTAQTAELAKVRGLKSGADDYITKPFGRQELLARVETVLRRSRDHRDVSATYADGLLTIDFGRASVEVNGKEVALTPTEFKLLAALVRHPRTVLSSQQLLELVWNDPYGISPAQVKLYIGYLRRKLAAGGVDAPIETVRGFGYRYSPPPR